MSEKNRLSIGARWGANELSKTHFVYDGSNRLTDQYDAPTDAAHGAKCILTRYQYVGATAVISDIVEESALWDSAWDF
jgi:hypothetical protein